MDQLNWESMRTVTNIRATVMQILQNRKDVAKIKKLQNLLESTSKTIVRAVEPMVLSLFYGFLKDVSEDKTCYTCSEKLVIVDTFKSLFDNIIIEKLPLFFNMYGFLLFELYDAKQHIVLNIDEDYKLSIVLCMTSLASSLSATLTTELYTKENAPKLCQMMFALLEIAKNHPYNRLRISSINCIMAMAQVLKEDTFSDIVLRSQIADVFMFFLPGLASQLRTLALSDEKVGHQIPVVALRAWGRIVALLMQDYNAADRKINLRDLSSLKGATGVALHSIEKVWKNENELMEYVKTKERSPEWYKENDRRLQTITVQFVKLAHHSHRLVRLELTKICDLLIENCCQTMPTSVSSLIEIVIALSEDSDEEISKKSKSIMGGLSKQCTSIEFHELLGSLEDGFYNLIESLPRKFNGIDEQEMLVSLNMLSGYINLFGEHSLTRVLLSIVHLKMLMTTLIDISEFDKSGMCLLEEYSIPDYDSLSGLKSQWKTFRHFKEESICAKLESICSSLAKYGATLIVSDCLLDTFANDAEHRKEATFLLNGLVTGMNPDDHFTIMKSIVNVYIEKDQWNLPLTAMVDDLGRQHTLGDVRSNVTQVCLLVEGLGKIALTLKKRYNYFMLKTLYIVFERAGSGIPFIRTAGLKSLANMVTASGYSDLSDLITDNIDFFSFHIGRKLVRANEDVGVLNVLSVIMRYSTIDMLESTSNLVEELLIKSTDSSDTQINTYLNVFKIYIQSLRRWFNISAEVEPMKTRKQKRDEWEGFKVSDVKMDEGFSDDIMDKSAEEMWKEDLQKSKKQLEDEMCEPENEGYKKPEPPNHIKLTVKILQRSRHFLPSKNVTRKLLVLEILREGVEILRDWEDELLPTVHLIWGPLVERFKEFENPLIINISFQLLISLANVSKDFIRNRTIKEVLPSILQLLANMTKDSYLKDRGSVYRYSQGYKLQLLLLDQLPRVVTDLDMLETDVEAIMEVVFKYFSNKQPVPLQKSAVEFVKTIYIYDRNHMDKIIIKWQGNYKANAEYEKNLCLIQGN